MTGLVLPYRGISPKIAESAFIAHTATVIGDVHIGAETSIWFGVTLRGDVNNIRIGKRTNIQDGTVCHVTYKGSALTIGDDVTVGHNATLHACTLQDMAFVGMGAVVMDDVVVESGAMVAAGAVVTPGKVVRKGEIWAGVPAKPFRQMTQQEIDYLPWSAAHYVRLGQQYIQEEMNG